MKKSFALFLAFAVAVAISGAASAQAFKDVPAKHWAASSVYDLVRMGVTKGYPDGTFRGTKNITRYETAVFLSKLAKAIGSSADVKSDISALRREIRALKSRPAAGGGMPLSGSYEGVWKFGNLLTQSGSTRGSVAGYRLMLSAAQDMGKGADVKVNLDTMDYGWGSTAGGVLGTELLDIESNVKLDLAALGLDNPVAVKLTCGPGAMQHTDLSGGVLPSETGVVFSRPDTAVMASTALWGMDVSGGYIAKSKSAAGRLLVSQITGTVGYQFEGVPMVNTLKLDATGDYICTGMFSSTTKDIRASVAMAAPLAEKIDAAGTLGIGGSNNSNLMVEGALSLNDVWDTGTVAVIRLSKVGSDYISDAFATECFDLAGLDTFDRALAEGTVNLGGEVTQNVSDDIKLVGKGDLRMNADYKYEAPNGRLTAQGGVCYAVAPNTSLDAIYRVYQDKATSDTTDVAALGLMYKF
jgi:hypothetical protein